MPQVGAGDKIGVGVGSDAHDTTSRDRNKTTGTDNLICIINHHFLLGPKLGLS
jgi:hypothetical protein